MLAYIVVFSLVLAASAQTCTKDYQCANGNVPYGYCANGGSDCSGTVPGFAVLNGSIYYAQQCRADGSYFGVYTFKRIPIGGGVPTAIYSRQAVPADVNPSRVIGVEGNLLFFDILRRQPSVGIRSIDMNNGTEAEVFTNSFPQNAFDFDPYSTTPATYVCNYNVGLYSNYTIERYPVFPREGTVSSKGVLYTTPAMSSCKVLKRHADVDLLFTTESSTYDGTTTLTTTNFYRGTITCSNCAVPRPFFTAYDIVVDFVVYGDYLFYTTASYAKSPGLFRVKLDGSNPVKISSETAYAVHVENNRVIYSSSTDIKSVDFQGNDLKLLSLPRSGTCVCRPGFTGASCDKCNGQVQWEPASQRPLCVSLLGSGSPSSCYYDYQCPNVPYTVCRSDSVGKGTCQCFNGNFTGSRCDQCDPPRLVTWTSYGYPNCA